MKKTVVFVLALTSLSAFASKARLEALGENKDGSYYIQDNRDMFLNPAHVNYHKDFVTYEWGSSLVGSSSDTTTAPRSEGGFYRSMGAMNYGLYLGSQSDRIHAKQTATDTALIDQNNPVDLFVGGEASSMKWGANLTYSTSETNNAGSFKKSEDYLGAKVGVEMANLEVFAHTDIQNKAKGATQANDELNGKFGGRLGATYMLNDLKLYGSYGRYSYDWKNDSGAAINTDKYRDTDWKLGVGRTASVNDKTKVFTRVEYNCTNSNIEAPNGDNHPTKGWTLPVAIGLEHDALSWLMLRGSVTQDLWNSATTDSTYTKRSNNTTVNMGSTLALGSVKLDGLIGTTTAANGTGTGTNTGVLSTNNLMTRVALRYNF